MHPPQPHAIHRKGFFVLTKKVWKIDEYYYVELLYFFIFRKLVFLIQIHLQGDAQ